MDVLAWIMMVDVTDFRLQVEKQSWDCARGLAQSARVPGERRNDGAGCLHTSGPDSDIRSNRGLHARWRGWSM
jgi:hypothetical protein